MCLTNIPINYPFQSTSSDFFFFFFRVIHQLGKNFQSNDQIDDRNNRDGREAEKKKKTGRIERAFTAISEMTLRRNLNK